MKYHFTPYPAKSPQCTHKRLADGVFGIIRELRDTVTGSSLLTSLDGFEALAPPPPPAPRVPQSLSNWRAKAAIQLAGLTAAVETVMQGLDEPARTVALSAWENGAELDRRGPTVLALAAALGLTDTQVDALFVTGGSLTV